MSNPVVMIPRSVSQFSVESESSPGKDYLVTEMSDGSFKCSCKGWTLHSPRKDCKHIRYHKTFGGREINPMLMAMMRHQEKEKRAA